METLVSAVGWLLQSVLFKAVFHAIGWAVLKVVTLGRYPRPPRGLDDWAASAEEIALVGLLSTVLAFIAVACWLA
ncbi:hypothetical protein QO239_13805 [Cupriavidus taiwanensis]|uniref:hypothetical protein n=1 Tax=Cupriavidus taiwanensis TaxID=164546 RepID=UPI0015748105|nr:hypothetical protein [Cupriavidus taiwanensis]MDK3023673.1 hypothetical protein [Cupriavidus taiwanensis]NSX15108.1 hypothetical protein [Cupriavidus taiwanensis]